MKPMLTAPQGYYISGLRVRKELIPLPDMLAYRCVTTKADGPVGDDKVLPGQVDFDDLLIDLEVYKPRNPIQAVYAATWRRWHMDKIMPLVRSDEPKETLLYRLDSPHRPKGA